MGTVTITVPEDFAVTVTTSVGSMVPDRVAQWRIDVVVEHKPTGTKIGYRFEGFVTESQLQKKANEAVQDLCVVRSLPAPGGALVATRVLPDWVE